VPVGQQALGGRARPPLAFHLRVSK
jgi:hypothetical protein